ncbi:hypothetical protein CGCSCA1_v000446 [Colletotrichum siamense]|nr:hypothetical protein CGCSCA1_v000446 [Colletotrichum siamense]
MAEIAGLVLGAVPLVISALEHYQEFVDPAVAFFKWRGELSKVILRLVTERATYDQNLRLMLARIVSHDELDRMVEDPQDHLWTSRELLLDLKSELSRAYGPCMALVKEMEAVMVTIAAGLDIDGSDQVLDNGLQTVISANPPVSKTPDPRQRFQFLKRVNFTMKRRTIDKKLTELESCNRKLRDLLTGADAISAIQQDEGPTRRPRIRFVAPLQSIRANASRVHGGLCGRWCSDHDYHHAGLLLEQRIARRIKKSRKGNVMEAGKMDRFGVSLWRAAVMTWLDTEFRIDDSLIRPRSENAPKVTFSMAELKESLDETESITVLEVKDICTTIEEAMHPHIGFAIDSSDILRGLYQVETQKRTLAQSHTTLDEFLPSIKRHDYVLADYYCLAVTLASSVLQLNETPWLHQPWSRRSIAFLRLKGGNASSVDIRHPYLTCQYCADEPSPQFKSDVPPAGRINMLALAIMLVELKCGSPIESLWQDQDLPPDGQPNMWTDLSTVTRWLDVQVNEGNLSFGFTSAITYCLQCYVNPIASLDDTEFVQSIEENVLEPLEREMQQLLYG